MPPRGYESFLRAICENPADDAPRLVYADWLEENGDPDRGRFIRADCLAHRAADPRVAEKWAGVAAELWRRHRALWVAELPSVLGLDWDWGSVRGFFSTIIVRDATRFETLADSIFSAAPVDAVTFSLHHLIQPADPIRHIWSVLSCSRAGQFRRVWASRYRLGASLGQLVARIRGLTGLRQLWVRKTRLGDPGVAALAAAPHLGTLVELDLAYNDLTDRAAHSLAESPHLAGLASLNVRGNPLTASGRAVLHAKFGNRVIMG